MTYAEWSESHWSKALHQRSSGSFSQAQSIRECQTPSQQNTVATDESSATNCFAQAEAQSVED